MSVRSKIREIEDKLDLTKKYPDYFNKLIFRIGVGFLFLFMFVLLMNFGLNASWVNYQCESPNGCQNLFITCQEDYYSNFAECQYYLENECVGHNCNASRIDYKDYIGEQPPTIVKYGYLIVFLIISLTIFANHINYLMRGKK